MIARPHRGDSIAVIAVVIEDQTALWDLQSRERTVIYFLSLSKRALIKIFRFLFK